jgi:hypothetical protein
MDALLGALWRLLSLTALAVVAVAVLLGRSAPDGPEARGTRVRHRARPRYRAIRTEFFREAPHVPRLLDRRTGALVPCSIPGAEDLEILGFSPWRDAAGQHHMLARCGGNVPDQPLHAVRPLELVRYTFPAGEILSRLTIENLATGRICWAPDRSDRIVFAGGDGQLYRRDLSVSRGAKPGEARSEPVGWGANAELGKEVLTIRDPCWPDEPSLGGCLLVALTPRGREGEPGFPPGAQLWWLRLDPEARTIVAARRAILADGDDAPASGARERLPAVGRASDGTLLLAYLARPAGRWSWELWTAPIVPDAAGGLPRVVSSARRRLAEGCAPITPAFSLDGRSVFAALRDARSRIRMGRFPIGVPTEASRAGARSCRAPTRYGKHDSAPSRGSETPSRKAAQSSAPPPESSAGGAGGWLAAVAGRSRPAAAMSWRRSKTSSLSPYGVSPM